MNRDFLTTPERTKKPRSSGLTLIIDNGSPTGLFTDIVRSHTPLIDAVKFGWGTALVTKDIQEKLRVLNDLGIGYFFGGTLFEKALHQERLEEFLAFCRDAQCRYMEISDGTIEINEGERRTIIERMSKDFEVFSEVGYKDPARSQKMFPQLWVHRIKADLDAGAKYVIAEARESGTSGFCRENGEPRFGLIEELVAAELPIERIVFEAPRKALQLYLIERFGSNVNLGNIPLDGVVSLETLRLGLRFDSFYIGGARPE